MYTSGKSFYNTSSLIGSDEADASLKLAKNVGMTSRLINLEAFPINQLPSPLRKEIDREVFSYVLIAIVAYFEPQ